MRNKEISRLVQAVQQKEEDAFERLFAQIWDSAYYYCNKQLQNVHDAEDAAQEVAIRVYNIVDTIRSPEAFNKILSKIMIGVCADIMRRSNPPTTEIRDIEEITDIALEDSEEFLPEAVLEKQELREQVAKLVNDLPDKQREAIMLYYFSELRQVEICEVTNSELNAVNNRLVTARKTLREQVEKLLKKGDIHCMAVTPILTRILREEMKATATPEIGARIWMGVALKLGLSTGTSAISTGVETAAQSGSQASGVSSASSPLLNLGIAIAVTAAVASGTYLGIHMYTDYRDSMTTAPPALVQMEETADDIIAALKKVTNRPELEVFLIAYGFHSSETERYGNADTYSFFSRSLSGQQLWIGSFEDAGGGFEITYEIVDPDIGSPESLRQWFEENST